MKYIFTLLTVLFILFGCSDTDFIPNDLESIGIRGPVESISDTTFKAIQKFGDIQLEEIPNRWDAISRRSFNQDGNILVSTYSNPTSVTKAFRCSYDGNRLVRKHYKTTDQKLLEISEKANPTIDESISSYVCQYNDVNMLDEINFYGDNNLLVEKVKFEHEPTQSVTTIDRYDSNGDLVMYYKEYYNDNHDLIEHISFSKHGKIVKRWVIDAMNMVDSFYMYNDMGKLEGEIITLKEDNGRIEKEYYNSKLVTLTKYDDYQNITELQFYDNQKVYLTWYWDYEYDEFKNWIKRAKYNSYKVRPAKSIEEVTKRKIVYFE